MLPISHTFRTFLTLLLFGLFSTGLLAQGDLIGPVYPPPLGNTNTVAGGADAIGKTGGITWTIGNVALVAHDEVYWGPVHQMIRMSMNNNTFTADEVMDYRPDLSNLGNGVMIFTGVTNTTGYSSAVYTRCIITVTTTGGTPLPLTDASVLGLPEDVGAVGSLRDWGVTATGYYKVNLRLEAGFSTSSYQPAFLFFDNYHSGGQVYSDVEAGFYYINSPPVLEINNTITMQEGQTVVIPQTVLKSRDVESLVTQVVYTIGPAVPAHGVLRLNNVALSAGGTFTQDHINKNQVTYQHNGDASPSDEFSFRISDAQGATMPPAAVTPYVFNIQISQVNHPPVAVNSSGTATVGTTFYGQFQATDSDLPAQPLTFSLVQNGKKGTATLLNFNDGSFSYNANNDAFGLDTLIFQVSDGEASSVNPGLFIITLINNRAPVITPIADVTMAENETRTVTISTSDPDGNQVTLTVNNLPSFATFSTPGGGTGTIQFAPLTGDIGDYPGIEVIAEDNGTPVRSSREEFNLTVLPEIKPVISLNPSGLIDFDTVRIGSDSTVVVNIYNLGNGVLTVEDIVLSGGNAGEFTVGSPVFPFDISPGDSAGFTVTFAPSVEALSQTTLIIDSSDPANDPVEVTLRGYGIHPPSDVLYHLGDLKAPPTVVIEYPVDIEIFENKELCAFGFNLSFDHAVLTYQDWTRGSVIPSSGYNTAATLINDSTLNISGFRKNGSPITRSGDIAHIAFLVNAGAPLDTSDLHIIHPSAGDCLGRDLVANSYDTGHIIVDIYARLTGRINHFDPLAPELGRPLAKIPVLLTDPGGNIVDQTVTDANGFYVIDSVLTLQDYILMPKLIDDETNLRRTVNSTDAYRAFSAANESIPFPNRFQYEIGDANNNDDFNTTDAYVIFQLASYQMLNLRSYGLDDWNFVPVQSISLAKCTVDNPHEIELFNLLRDTDGLDFIGGINGDVNGTGNDLLNFPKIQANPVTFNIAAARLSADGVLSVPVKIETNGETVCALQFEIAYNGAQMEYAGYLPTEMTPTAEKWMLYLEKTPEYKITTAAFVMDQQHALRGNGVLVYLHFRMKGDPKTSGEMSFSFTGTPVAGGPDGYDLPVSWGDGILNVEEAILPAQIVLNQNYPNPFNPSTTIEFTLPENSRVSLKIYNTIGEIVSTLVTGDLPAGSHRYIWDASGLATGVYYYRLETRETVLTKKMLLLQ